jgi:hypothetical protein
MDIDWKFILKTSGFFSILVVCVAVSVAILQSGDIPAFGLMFVLTIVILLVYWEKVIK